LLILSAAFKRRCISKAPGACVFRGLRGSDRRLPSTYPNFKCAENSLSCYVLSAIRFLFRSFLAYCRYLFILNPFLAATDIEFSSFHFFFFVFIVVFRSHTPIRIASNQINIHKGETQFRRRKEIRNQKSKQRNPLLPSKTFYYLQPHRTAPHRTVPRSFRTRT